ncbi:uncharacterized protein LACBIDRAFT_299780 [Laccaria bicolor S238N-H82]|uniref:Predicted protein n=1 Tax=Laccaria bicolor (strain S238N-H82 / ATCC MYA-4686) TaxID=486041 RepID=B0DFE9_LACBS|nr:uncharacterized protein LACBIDRAFT_299780 [Laccaria bicolor S238N-H82]EDR06853.1 predicted protein [Laccaria bicolor S238N-H82]|eukprot:XP_001882700.1 predicted protein [Laccaria bicolor S238N-H82]
MATTAHYWRHLHMNKRPRGRCDNAAHLCCIVSLPCRWQRRGNEGSLLWVILCAMSPDDERDCPPPTLAIDDHHHSPRSGDDCDGPPLPTTTDNSLQGATPLSATWQPNNE